MAPTKEQSIKNMERIIKLIKVPKTLVVPSECYLSAVPPTGWVWHKTFFKVGLGTEPKPRRTQHSQKCLEPCQHSPKKGCLKHQVINLTPPRRVKAWGDGPLRLKVCQVTRHARPDLCCWHHGLLKCFPSTGFCCSQLPVFKI